MKPGCRYRRSSRHVAIMYDSSVSEHQTLRVLLYSDDSDVRETVKNSLGNRPHPDLPAVEFIECATEPVVWQHLDSRTIDVAILDGETAPAGGMGVARQLKDEVYQAPPVLLLTARPQDAWLATWSRVEAVVPQPLDPFRLADVFIDLAQSALAAKG